MAQKSYYLNELRRIKKQPEPRRQYGDHDADYCIKSGITIGPYQQDTLEKQGWESRQ